MLLRHGHVIAEGWWSPFAPQHQHMLFSLSKSFTSTAIGMLVADGALSVDDPVLQYFADDAPAGVNEHLAAMRVRHLLSMSTGHEVDTMPLMRASADGNWARAFLAVPVIRAPGTHFLYNTGATYMLSAIVQQVTRRKLLDYLTPRLMQPLGIEGATWEECPRGINVGGYGLNTTTEDIAKFGQLYLQQGVWHGMPLVPGAWINEATSKHISNGDDPNSDWAQGYGYQFWRCRHNMYRGDGAFGQYCIVMPGQHAVLAITSGLQDMQPPLNLVWEHVLPSLHAAPLPVNSAAQQHLVAATGCLAIAVPDGAHHSPVAHHVTGKTYAIEPNRQKLDSVSFEFAADGCTLHLHNALGESIIGCGNSAWLVSTTMFWIDARPGPFQIAAASAWQSQETCVIKVIYYDTPFMLTITARFSGDSLDLVQQISVAFGSNEPVQFQGAWMPDIQPTANNTGARGEGRMVAIKP